MVVLILKIYLGIVVVITLFYFARHMVFTLNRAFGRQRVYYQDLVDGDLPSLTVLVPMHNEEAVAAHVLERLVACDYPADRVEIIPIVDHSTDRTAAIVADFARRHDIIRPLVRNEGRRGKPAGLNEAMAVARGEIVVVFDADYLPPRGILRDMALAFKDPEVGAMMGRVIPINTPRNLLTRLLDIERSAGYQIDQQSRYNLKLVPQYGGTVGGYRRAVFQSFGGFDERILAEDTALTFAFLVKGWKVIYANRVECYEEAPESWTVRGRQIRRWARGHTQVMLRYLGPLLRSPYLTFWEKLDGLLLLFIYVNPPLLLVGTGAALALFFLGEMQVLPSLIFFLMVAGFNTFGNFAAFTQIGMASVVDGSAERIRLIPFVYFNFLFNMWFTTMGFVDAGVDHLTLREISWQKTTRFRGGQGGPA